MAENWDQCYHYFGHLGRMSAEKMAIFSETNVAVRQTLFFPISQKDDFSKLGVWQRGVTAGRGYLPSAQVHFEL
jgi:hypothetical protein